MVNDKVDGMTRLCFDAAYSLCKAEISHIRKMYELLRECGYNVSCESLVDDETFLEKLKAEVYGE